MTDQNHPAKYDPLNVTPLTKEARHRHTAGVT